jgi:hypothetical protein
VCESIVAFSWCPQQQSNKATFDDTKAFDFIKNLKTLKELRLNTSQAGFAAASIMEQLQEFTNLRTLHIDHTGYEQNQIREPFSCFCFLNIYCSVAKKEA